MSVLIQGPSAPTVLPAPSPVLDVPPGLTPDDIAAPLFAYMS